MHSAIALRTTRESLRRIKSPRDIFNSLSLLLKILECGCCLVNCTMISARSIRTSFSSMESYNLALVTSGGFTIICLSLIFIHLFDEPNHLYLLLILLVGAVLHYIFGAFTIIHFIGNKERNGVLVLAICSSTCAVLMTADWFRELFYPGRMHRASI